MKPLIEREQYMQTLRHWQDWLIIKVITGVRRCGKTTLVKMFVDELLQSGILPEQVQYYDFESRKIRAIGGLKEVYYHVQDRVIPDKVNYVFLDEVQTVDRFHYIVDGLLVRQNVDIYVIASNAHFLSGEFATLFAKKYIEISIFPLQFSEYYDLLDLKSSNLSKTECLEKYLTEGGVPEYFNQKNISQEQADEFMRGVLQTLLKKDLIARLKVKKKKKKRRNFNQMVYYVFDSIGSFSLLNSISNMLQIKDINIDKKSINRYLDALCDLFVLYRATHFEIRNEEHLETLYKYYFVDPGFRKVCFLRQDMQYDNTYWLENMVYFELLRRNREVYVGLIDNKEVDFIAIDHNGCTSYYQVSWTTVDKEVLRRELASLKLIKNSNPKYILTMDTDGSVYNDVRKVNVVDWLLEKEGLGKLT